MSIVSKPAPIVTPRKRRRSALALTLFFWFTWVPLSFGQSAFTSGSPQLTQNLLAGAFLYLLGISAWLILTSRRRSPVQISQNTVDRLGFHSRSW